MSSTGQKIWAFFKEQGKVLASHFYYDPFWPKIKAFFVHPRWKRARLIVGIALVVLIVAYLVIPYSGRAAADSHWWLAPFGWFFWMIAEVLATLLQWTGIAFNYVITGSPFDIVIGTAAVKAGWATVRDVCNLVFVLILLGIGFATILRVPAYHVKKLIVPFIVALLLINFSKLICGVVTDFCHVIMISFASAMTGGTNYSGAIAQGIGLGAWLDNTESKWGSVQYIEAIIIICVFLIALIFALLLLLVLLVVRWITLVVLTIFSPLVYAAEILPTTKGFAKKWWQQFLQNAFYGPVAVFMVYLAIVIMRDSIAGKMTVNGAGGGAIEGITVQTLISMIVACVLLYKAVTMSRSMGIAGASAVIKTGTKWGKGLAGAMAAPVTDRVKAAWGARRSAIQAARKESGERIGTSAAMRVTMPGANWLRGRFRSGAAQKKSRQAQQAFRRGQEKDAEDRTNPAAMNDLKLDAEYGRAKRYEKLGMAREMAKRGRLDKSEFEKTHSLQERIGSQSGLARLDDAMKSSRPADFWDTDAGKFNGQALTNEQRIDQFRRMDIMDVDPSQLNKIDVLGQMMAAKGATAMTNFRKRDSRTEAAMKGTLTNDNINAYQAQRKKHIEDTMPDTTPEEQALRKDALDKNNSESRKLRTEAIDIESDRMFEFLEGGVPTGEMESLMQKIAPEPAGKSYAAIIKYVERGKDPADIVKREERVKAMLKAAGSSKVKAASNFSTEEIMQKLVKLLPLTEKQLLSDSVLKKWAPSMATPPTTPPPPTFTPVP